MFILYDCMSYHVQNNKLYLVEAYSQLTFGNFTNNSSSCICSLCANLAKSRAYFVRLCLAIYITILALLYSRTFIIAHLSTHTHICELNGNSFVLNLVYFLSIHLSRITKVLTLCDYRKPTASLRSLSQ